MDRVIRTIIIVIVVVVVAVFAVGGALRHTDDTTTITPCTLNSDAVTSTLPLCK